MLSNTPARETGWRLRIITMDDVVFRKHFLNPREQAALVAAVWKIQPGFYVPKTRWGKAMNLRMNCLGHHWSARDYKYHPTARVDVDGLTLRANS